MEVYALVGQRGTGKSHHAQLLAHRYGINYLLDDGLLIKGHRILAGRSAKRENTRYGAIKRALLHDDEHARQLQDKLKQLAPPKLLILATSERMAEAIADRLGVPPPHRYIRIEDIVSPEAIERARQMRDEKNSHVIPLPTFTIKKEFPGYIVDPLRSFFRLPSAQYKNVAVERSIVRPVYSNLGNFYIAEHVVGEMVGYIAGAVPGVHRVDSVEIATGEGKMILDVALVLSLKSLPAKNLHHIAAEVQRRVKEQLEHHTGFYLDRVNVTAKKIHLDEKQAD